MYVVRRIVHTKPGEARRVASMLHKQSQIFRDAGQRSEFKVYFNGGTLPGDINVVVLEWTEEALMSPMREGNDVPPEAVALVPEIMQFVESGRIEFMELLTSDKMMDV